MDSGKSRGAILPLIVTLAALLGLCAILGLFARGTFASTLPASEGMPQVPPGQVMVQVPAPTVAAEVVPTREVPQPPQTITPTEVPVNPPPLTGNEGDVTGSEVEPVPVNPNDATGGTVSQPQAQGDQPPNSGIDESVQPFPAGANPSTASNQPSTQSSASSAGTGSAGYACGRRIVHVVQPGQNIFRIALRYDTTINAIVWRNGIDDVRFVRPGTRLVVVTCEQR